MKATPLLVTWHNDNAPIYSAHFQPHETGRLATAGGDNNVRVCELGSTTREPGTDDWIVVEAGVQRRRSESDLFVHFGKAYSGSQCRTVES